MLLLVRSRSSHSSSQGLSVGPREGCPGGVLTSEQPSVSSLYVPLCPAEETAPTWRHPHVGLCNPSPGGCCPLLATAGVADIFSQRREAESSRLGVGPERVGPSSEAAAPTPPPLPCHHRVRDRQQQDLSGADGRDCLTWGLLAPVNYTRGCFGCLDQDGEKARHSLEWGGGQEEGLAKGLRQPPYDF